MFGHLHTDRFVCAIGALFFATLSLASAVAPVI